MPEMTEAEVAKFLNDVPCPYISSWRLLSPDCLLVMREDHTCFLSVQCERFECDLSGCFNSPLKDVWAWVQQTPGGLRVFTDHPQAVAETVAYDLLKQLVERALQTYPNNDGLHTFRFELAFATPPLEREKKDDR